MKYKRQFFLFFCLLLYTLQPLCALGNSPKKNRFSYYIVKRNDTVYSIAKKFKINSKIILKTNKIHSANKLFAGKRILIPRHFNKRYLKGIKSKRYVLHKKKIFWRWPVRGKLIKLYSSVNPGINIHNKLRSKIYASAPGTVLYTGDGIHGYGKLIVLRHRSNYISTYSHNSKVLVGLGEKIKAGQLIAYMGNTESQRVMLHFEIRKYGKPINPLKLLKQS
jgi:murein DD-endopeptidase MepM/ murein hydrolase activator NlpD